MLRWRGGACSLDLCSRRWQHEAQWQPRDQQLKGGVDLSTKALLPSSLWWLRHLTLQLASRRLVTHGGIVQGVITTRGAVMHAPQASAAVGGNAMHDMAANDSHSHRQASPTVERCSCSTLLCVAAARSGGLSIVVSWFHCVQLGMNALPTRQDAYGLAFGKQYRQLLSE